MARLVKLRWRAEFSSGLPRRDRQGCEYEAYIPDPLMGRKIMLDGSTAADVAWIKGLLREREEALEHAVFGLQSLLDEAVRRVRRGK